MNVGILFSGGKDSMLATELAIKQGKNIKCLISFDSQDNRLFDELNLKVAEMAAQCMQLPLVEYRLQGSASQQNAALFECLMQIKKRFELRGIVSGASHFGPRQQAMAKTLAELGLPPAYPLAGSEPRSIS